MVLERLDGGTLTQMLGYDTRIRDRRRRFWKKNQFSYLDVLRCARSLADAMAYCQGEAIPGAMVLHRDLKPDNIGFTLSGQVKVLDFGLAHVLDNATPESSEVYEMSGETGSVSGSLCCGSTFSYMAHHSIALTNSFTISVCCFCSFGTWPQRSQTVCHTIIRLMCIRLVCLLMEKF